MGQSIICGESSILIHATCATRCKHPPCITTEEEH